MKKFKLNKQEREIEKALVSGEYVKIDPQEFQQIARAIVHRKKHEQAGLCPALTLSPVP